MSSNDVWHEASLLSLYWLGDIAIPFSEVATEVTKYNARILVIPSMLYVL